MSDDDRPAFGWLDFMDVATVLADRGDEASQRSAVSRSYYAIFHTAQLVLELHDAEYASMRTRDSHQQVWDRLGALRFKQAKSAVRSGRTLLRYRKDADYHLEVGQWARRTQEALELGNRTLGSLQDLLDTP